MYCTKCGSKNSDKAKFCTKCGAEIINEPSQPINKSSVGGVDNEVGVPKKKSRYILKSVIFVVVFALVFIVAYYFSKEDTTSPTNDSSKQDLIEQTVSELKNEMQIPQDVDTVTRLTDIQAVPNAIRYVYLLHGVDVSKISNTSLKNSIAPQACQSKETREGLLDQEIGMEYYYTVQDSSQTFFVSITKEDCI